MAGTTLAIDNMKWGKIFINESLGLAEPYVWMVVPH